MKRNSFEIAIFNEKFKKTAEKASFSKSTGVLTSSWKIFIIKIQVLNHPFGCFAFQKGLSNYVYEVHKK